MRNYKIFLSHYAKEASVAVYLKDFIEDVFAGAVTIFASSNGWSLRPGDEWTAKIREELRDSQMMLVLLSPDSIARPWVNFEAGAAWISDMILVPMLHRNLTLDQLEHPFSEHQCVSLADGGDVERLIERIAKESGLSPRVSEGEYCSFAQGTQARSIEIDRAIASGIRQRPVRYTVRYYLYTKSLAQYRQTLSEVGDRPVSCFRKPDITDVYQALFDHGQPDATIVSLDEYWIKDLAQAGILEDLSDFVKRRQSSNRYRFHEELLPSGEYKGKNWSVPHFTDFSYYNCQEQHYDLVVSWLRELSTTDDYERSLDRLKRELQTDRLLAYDFRIPGTQASVVLEFIKSFGDGVESLQSPSKAVSPRNVLALKLLRSMVGPCPNEGFFPGEPTRLDEEYGDVPLLKVWHSRVSDMPRLQERHVPIKPCPISGTLGGWHVGILARCPSFVDGLQGLKCLLSKEAQQARFKIGAGLPTLAEFYTSPDLATQIDSLTGWSLKEIEAYVAGLIKRSKMPSFPILRLELSSLHNQIMLCQKSAIEDVLAQWAHDLSSKSYSRGSE